MKDFPIVIVALATGLMIAGCSTGVPLQMPSSSISTSALPPKSDPVRGTPVVANRPARLFVWAGFKEKDCTAVPATMVIASAPAKGTVAFRANQATTVQFSNSGKCIGQSLQGTGVYYTAKQGQAGGDSFTVTASTPTGQAVTKTFNVRIVD